MTLDWHPQPQHRAAYRLPAGKREQGFTLLEVLVSLLLLSLLSLISWRALDSVQRGSQRLDAMIDETQAIARVFGQLTEDLHHHVGPSALPPARPAQAGQAPVARTPANAAALPPGVQVAQTDQDPATLAIIRSSPAQDGRWQHVIWRQEGSTLLRAVGRADITRPLPQPADSTPVLESIQDFHIRVWIPGHGWMPPDTSGSASLATGLEIRITRRQRGQTVTYRKVVLLQ